MKLRHRLVLVIALMLPLGLVAGGVAFYLYAAGQVDGEMGTVVALAEKTVRERLDLLPDDANRHDYLVRTVRIFDNDPDVRATLVSPSGDIVATSVAMVENVKSPLWLERALTGGRRQQSINLEGRLAGEGSFLLQATPTREVEEVWEEMLLLLGVIGGVLAAVGALISAVIGQITRPLEKFAAALSEVAGGRFTAHVPESGPQELAAIYRQFNKMALRLKDAELQNRALNLQLSTVQEEERADIARDLHDEIGPFLFAVDVDAQTIPQYLDRGMPAEVTHRAGSIRQSVAHMQTHLKSILSRLRPAALLDLGLGQAVDHLVKFWSKRRPDITIETEISRASFGLARDEVAFRVIQEAVNNSIRHAEPSRIVVSAGSDDDGHLAVSVSDDGSGIPGALTPGFGLSGMRERVTALGGTLDISAGPGDRGTRITAVLPPQQDKAQQGNDRRALTS